MSKKVANKNLKMSFSDVVKLSREDHGLSICRVFTRHIDSAKTSSGKFYRKQLVTITNLDNGLSIVREVAGANNRDQKAPDGSVKTRPIRTESIGLDYDSRDLLGITGNEANIEMRVAGRIDRAKFFWYHEDKAVRFATHGRVELFVLGSIGVILGIISVVLAIA